MGRGVYVGPCAMGTCCTLASPDKTFEAHLFLAKVKEVVLARSERGGRKIYAVRFFDEAAAGGGAAAEEGAPPARPMLTVVLHGGEDGAVIHSTPHLLQPNQPNPP